MAKLCKFYLFGCRDGCRIAFLKFSQIPKLTEFFLEKEEDIQKTRVETQKG
jgi:hypothetical protein